MGTRLKLEILRDRKPLSTEVEVGDRNKVIARLSAGPDTEGKEKDSDEAAGGILGLSVRSLTNDQAGEISRELHLAGPQGVLVSDVDPAGFAADLGLQRGDIILSVNHQPVHSADDFAHLQSQLKSGRDVLFLIARRTQRTFTTLYLADRLP